MMNSGRGGLAVAALDKKAPSPETPARLVGPREVDPTELRATAMIASVQMDHAAHRERD